MRWPVLRGFVALLFGTFAALGVAGLTGTTGVAGATTGFGSQVAATQWTATNPPALPSGESYDDSVSCVSSIFCVATVLDEGGPTTASVQVWNGATWTTVGLPVPAGATEVELISVSCTSAVFCVAVGTDGTSSTFLPFADQWDGSSWSISSGATGPSGSTNAELSSVSCTGPTWCMATGIAADSTFDNISSFALQWNGTGWVPSAAIVLPAGSSSELTSISCTGPTNCMAVGGSSVGAGPLLVPHAQSSPGRGGLQSPLGFLAPGLHANVVPHAPPAIQLLAEQWNGSSWSNSPVTAPPGITDPEFESVSCAGTGFCMATGGFEDISSSAFAEAWSGGTWSVTPLPASPTAGPAFFTGVSCISPTSCTGVGETIESDDLSVGTFLAGSWNGVGWSLQAVEPPVGANAAAWFGASCLTGGFCVVTGGIATDSTTQPSNAQAAIGRTGYRLAAADGGLFSYGPPSPNLGAPFAGSMGGMHLNAPIVGTATMPSGDGYYLVASDGGVFNFGSATFYGSAGGTHLNKPIVGMAVTADGGGYWLVASDGGVFSYGDAQFDGSAGALTLSKPIVGMAATPNGRGYYLVASDGGVFTYGNAVFAGSMAGTALNKPIVGMAVTPAGGYYLVGADGGVFNYGGAPLLGSAGSLHLNKPVVGMGVASGGYYLVASDGGIFSYPGGAAGPLFFGSTGGTPLQAPIVGIGA